MTGMVAAELHWKLLSVCRKAGVKEVYLVCSLRQMTFLITMMVVVNCLFLLRNVCPFPKFQPQRWDRRSSWS